MIWRQGKWQWAQVWLLQLACMLSAKDAINPSGMVHGTYKVKNTYLIFVWKSASMKG